jgi:hypothetical protein
MKKHFILFSILTFLMLQACAPLPFLTLDIPEDGFSVVQHIPEDSTGRKHNTLYMLYL